MSVQIVARLRRHGLHLTPRQLFEHPTVDRLAAVAGVPVESIGAADGPGGVPLTPLQRWFFERSPEASDPWVLSMSLLPSAPLHPGRLAGALGAVASHHDALALLFAREGAGWLQVRGDGGGSWPLTVVDLTAVSGEAALSLLEGQAQASLDLSRGPLARAVLFRLSGEPDRLLLLAHGLIVDAASWSILLEDLDSAYAQLSRGEPVVLRPAFPSFRHLAESLAAYAFTPEVLEELALWAAPEDEVPVPPGEGDARTGAPMRTVSTALDPELTHSLARETSAAYRTEPDDLLLAALAQTLMGRTGRPYLFVEIQRPGREGLALAGLAPTRTVGCLATRFPVRLDLDRNASPGDLIKAVKERLRAVPKNGLGYGLARYFHAGGERLRSPDASVAFELPSWSDEEPSSLVTFVTAPVRPSTRPAVGGPAFALTCHLSGAELRIVWTYDSGLYEQSAIERLAHSYLCNLQDLVEHCLSPEAGGFTPSDFAQLGLAQDDLDDLLAQIQEGLE